MNSIYFPNIYRANSLTKSTGMITDISYYQKFSVDNDDDLRLLMHIRTNKLIELLFMYDRVYVDRFELPVVLDQLASKDVDLTTEILKQGRLSIIDSNGIVTGCSKNKYFYSLSYGIRHNNLLSDVETIREEAFSKFKYRPSIDDVLIHIYKNAIKIENDYGKKLLKRIDTDLKSNTLRSKLDVTSKTSSQILKQDIPTINAYSEAIGKIYLSEMIDTKNIYIDDIIREVISDKVENLNAIKNVIDLNKLIKVYTIPDIDIMLIYDMISMNDLFKIKFSKEFNAFQNLVFNHSELDDDIVRAYINLLKKKSIGGFGFKSMRFLISQLSGFVNIFLGMGVSIADAFILDNVLDQYSNATKVEKTLLSLDEKYSKNIKIPNIVSEEYRRFYEWI